MFSTWPFSGYCFFIINNNNNNKVQKEEKILSSFLSFVLGSLFSTRSMFVCVFSKLRKKAAHPPPPPPYFLYSFSFRKFYDSLSLISHDLTIPKSKNKNIKSKLIRMMALKFYKHDKDLLHIKQC